MAKPGVALDPALFAMPLIGTDEDGAIKIIKAIFFAAKTVRENGPLDIFLLDDASERLANADMYPAKESIANMLARCGLAYVYTAHDVRVAVNEVISRARNVSLLSGISFFVPTQFSASPNIIADREGELRDALELTLLHAAIALRVIHPDLVRAVVMGLLERRGIQINADVELIDPPLEPGDQTELRDFVAVVRSEGSLEDYFNELSADVLWETAEGDEQLALAIKLKATNVRRAAGCGRPGANCIPFRMGQGFAASLQRWQASGKKKHASTTLDGCARLIAKFPKDTPNRYFQKTAAGKKIDVARELDGAEAFRVHLTKGHEGLRLLYWKCADGTIEFANIGDKDELIILH